MKGFKCSVCKFIFSRKDALDRHVLKGQRRCKVNRSRRSRVGSKRGPLRGGNVLRSIGKNSLAFCNYLRRNVQEQRRLSQASPIRPILVHWSPIPAGFNVRSRGVSSISSQIRQARENVQRTLSTAELHKREVAVTVASAYFYTAAGARILGFPALPVTKRYRQALHSRIVRSVARGDQLFNVFVHSHSQRSLMNLSGRQLALRVGHRVQDICTILDTCGSATNALDDELDNLVTAFSCPRLPKWVYTMALAVGLLMAGGKYPRERLLSANRLPWRSGTRDGLAYLTGPSADDYACSPALAMLHLGCALDEVNKGLRGFQIDIWELVKHLCEFKRCGLEVSQSGFPTSRVDEAACS